MGNLSGVVEDLKKELKKAQHNVQRFICRTRGASLVRWRVLTKNHCGLDAR